MKPFVLKKSTYFSSVLALLFLSLTSFSTAFSQVQPGSKATVNSSDSSGNDDSNKKEETNLQKLERCKPERWQGWCSSSVAAGSPESDPAPEGAVSAACLKTSMNVFREVFQSRKSGLASLSSSASDISSAGNSYRGGNADLSSTQSSAGISNAEEAQSQFATCTSTAEKLKKYIDSYSRDKESTRTFCSRVPKGGSDSMIAVKLGNFERATTFHKSVFVSTLPDYAKKAGISDDESKDLKISELSKTTDRDYGTALGNILNKVKKDCEKNGELSGEQIKIAMGSKSTANSFVGPSNPSAGAAAAKAGDTKPGLVDGAVNTATNSVKTEVNKTVQQGVQAGATKLKEEVGLTPKAATSMNNFTSPAAATPVTAAPTIKTPATTTATPPPTAAVNAQNATQVSAATQQITAALTGGQSKDQAVDKLKTDEASLPANDPNLQGQCVKLPTTGTLTSTQKTLRARCVTAGYLK